MGLGLHYWAQDGGTCVWGLVLQRESHYRDLYYAPSVQFPQYETPLLFITRATIRYYGILPGYNLGLPYVVQSHMRSPAPHSLRGLTLTEMFHETGVYNGLGFRV